MDVPVGVGGRFPLAEHGHRPVRGHVQVEHQVGLRQPQAVVLKVKEPLEKGRPLPFRDLAGLVYRVGGGVPVGQHQAAGQIVLLPDLFPGGVPVHRVEAGGGVGVHILRPLPELPAEVHPQQGGGFLLVLGEHQPPEGDPLRLDPLAQFGKLGGLAGPVGPLQDDEQAFLGGAHGFPRFRFSPAAATRKPGSLAIRPMRLGWWSRR